MDEISFNNYIPKQIDLEKKYQDELNVVLNGLLATLFAYIDSDGNITPTTLSNVFMQFMASYGQVIKDINYKHAKEVDNLANNIYGNVKNNTESINIIAKDLNVKTDDLFNSVKGRFLDQIPAAPIVIKNNIFTDANTKEDITKRCVNSLELFSTDVTSQSMVGLLLLAAVNDDYDWYIGDNEHDDRVRHQHKIDNDGITKRSIKNPPPSGLPGSERNCRCRIIKIGKNMNSVKLSGVTGNYIAVKQKHDDHIVVLCRVLTVGTYTDMNGLSVYVTEKTLNELATNYNNRLGQEFHKYKQSILENRDHLDPSSVAAIDGMTIEDFDLLPNKVDHNYGKIRDSVGNVIGKVFVKESLGKLALFAHIKVKLEENIKNVVSGLWRNLSLGFNTETNEMTEVSWVDMGADPDAQKILSAPVNTYTSNVNLTPNFSNPILDVLLTFDDTIALLQAKIHVKERSIQLCKQRRITFADKNIIETKLSNIKDVKLINNIFDILDDYIPLQTKKEQMIYLSQDEAKSFGETMMACSNSKIY